MKNVFLLLIAGFATQAFAQDGMVSIPAVMRKSYTCEIRSWPVNDPLNVRQEVEAVVITSGDEQIARQSFGAVEGIGTSIESQYAGIKKITIELRSEGLKATVENDRMLAPRIEAHLVVPRIGIHYATICHSPVDFIHAPAERP